MTNISQLGLFGILLLFVSIGPVQCRICTRTSAEKRVQTEKYPGTCHQTYNARCGWFSIKQCTFNETITCLKERNRTVTLYRIIEDCCPGYHRNRDGKCIMNAHSETGVQHGDSYDDDDKFFLGISHGAYAGIICGILFICCIALLTALHYRKRRLMKAKKDCVMAETDASQKQQMIPLERTGSPTPTA